MPRPFDPAELAPAVRKHPWRAIRQLLMIGWLIFPYMVTVWWGRQGWVPQSDDARRSREARAAIRFREAMVALGPTFIKIGQLLSTRPDIMPLAFTKALGALQDQVPAFDTDLAMAILREELAQPPEAVFAEFELRPISAASIGQVYRARLHTGEDVAVKIQRPNLDEAIKVDLAILRAMASLGTHVDVSRLGLPIAKDMPYVAIVDRFGQSLYDQIDFVQEAKNLDRFRANFEDFPGVSAPMPFWDFTTRRVLVEEFIEGFKFDDARGITGAGLEYIDVANLGVRAFIKQLLEDGFFHADTHPGNVLVRPNGEVIYIDFGMVDEISQADQRIMVDLFIHLVQLDFDAFISDLIVLEFLPEAIDRSRVLPIVEDVYLSQMGLKGRVLSLTEILDRIGQVMFDYPFYLPERFAFLMRSVSAMEGVVLSHAPDYKFLGVGLPYAGKLLLNPEKRAIRDKLIHDLMPEDTLQLDRLLELFEYAVQEPTFRLGELAQPGLSYLLSPDGKRFRHALTIAVLDPARLAPAGTLARVSQDILRDPSLDFAEVARGILKFLPTPEGLEWLDAVLPRLHHLGPDSAIAGLMPILGERLLESSNIDELISAAIPAGKAVLSDRALNLQSALDWVTVWLERASGRDLLAGLAPLAYQVSAKQREDVLYLIGLTLDNAELDLAPLVAAGQQVLLSPEGEPLRELILDWLGNGQADGVIWHFTQRALSDGALRSELIGGLGPILRFLGSREAGNTRVRLAELAWKRLFFLLPRP